MPSNFIPFTLGFGSILIDTIQPVINVTIGYTNYNPFWGLYRN